MLCTTKTKLVDFYGTKVKLIPVIKRIEFNFNNLEMLLIRIKG